MIEKEYWKGVITGALAVICLGVGAYGGYCFAGQSEKQILDRESKSKIRLMERLIESNYLEELDTDYIKEGMYTGLAAGLGDVYSRYYTAEQYAEITKENDGAYVGIGVVLQENEDGSKEVVECYRGAPGEQAGLQSGDRFVKVNGTDVSEMPLSEVVNMIQKSEEDSVLLLIQRGTGGELLEVTVPIKNVEIQYVFSEMYNEEIGYISITEFSGVTYKQYVDAFEKLKKEGMEKLIVDLRGNPGGLYTSVCEILDDILPEGLLIYTEDKYGKREETYSDAEAPMAIDMAVLVNENSASASEIFAGALKDYGAAAIVGTVTYGKGVVQSIYKLEDGSALKLTVSKYYTPKGSSIHEVGIQPDVLVELETESTETQTGALPEEKNKWDNQVEAAAETLTSKE